MKRKIVMFYPSIPKDAPEKVAEVLRGRMIGQGPKVDDFEREFCKKLQVENAIFVNSCTSALRLALSTIGVGPGDEVISTPNTMIATNTVILEQFANPVFADIQYETMNIDPNDIEHRITEKTKAIECVHFGGYPCDMDEIHKIAKDHNLPVVEDAAHALTATYKGKIIGSISDYTTFSFQAIKQINTIDGGMLCVKNNENFELAKKKRWFGIAKDKRKSTPIGKEFDVDTVGFKYNPTDIGATIGLEQLKILDSVVERRHEITKRYREELNGIEGITLLENKNDRKSGDWLFTIHVDKRLKFAEKMRSKGIEVEMHNFRNDMYTIFGPLRKDLPNMEKAQETAINIPLHNHLTDDDVDYIIKTIKQGW